MAIIASGSKHTLHYSIETEYGTLPTTPTWTPICHSACDLGLSVETFEDDSINPDRNITTIYQGNRQVTGSINARLAFGEYDDLIEAALLGTWEDGQITAGDVERSFTFERYFDLSTDEFHRYTGCKINTLNISVRPNENIGLTFGILGNDFDSDNINSQIAGSVYSPESTAEPFDSFTGSILEGGEEIGVVTELEITIDNGYEHTFSIAKNTPIEPKAGKARISGTLTAYYESKELYEKFINNTSSSLELTFLDTDGTDFIFEIPNLNYTAGNPTVSSAGPVTVPLEFTAVYSAISDSMIGVTRGEDTGNGGGGGGDDFVPLIVTPGESSEIEIAVESYALESDEYEQELSISFTGDIVNASGSNEPISYYLDIIVANQGSVEILEGTYLAEDEAWSGTSGSQSEIEGDLNGYSIISRSGDESTTTPHTVSFSSVVYIEFDSLSLGDTIYVAAVARSDGGASSGQVNFSNAVLTVSG